MLRPALYSLALLPCSAALSGVVRGAAPTRAGRLVMGRKPGVSSPEDISAFIKSAGDKLIVVDVRNPDFSKEPGDGESSKVAPIASSEPPTAGRPRAVNVVYDRATESMDLSTLPEEWVAKGGGKESVPVITHCGGGGRGQKARLFLEANGFGNVINGGGPEDAECWAVFGDK